jgi:hypothetical protein
VQRDIAMNSLYDAPVVMFADVMTSVAEPCIQETKVGGFGFGGVRGHSVVGEVREGGLGSRNVNPRMDMGTNNVLSHGKVSG